MSDSKELKRKLYDRLKVLKKKDEQEKLTTEEREELVDINSQIDNLNFNSKNELSISEHALKIISEEMYLTRIEKKEEVQEKRNIKFIDTIESSKKDIKKLHKSGKITSTSVSSFLTFLFFIPKNYFENTYVSSLVPSNYSSVTLSLLLFILWSYSIFFCLLFWFRANKIERKQEIFLSTLESEDNRNKFFEEFLTSSPSLQDFSKHDLNEFILGKLNMDGIRVFPLLNTGFDTHHIQLATESTTNLIIEDKLRQNIIIKIPATYNTLYKLAPL